MENYRRQMLNSYFLDIDLHRIHDLEIDLYQGLDLLLNTQNHRHPLLRDSRLSIEGRSAAHVIVHHPKEYASTSLSIMRSSWRSMLAWRVGASGLDSSLLAWSIISTIQGKIHTVLAPCVSFTWRASNTPPTAIIAGFCNSTLLLGID